MSLPHAHPVSDGPLESGRLGVGDGHEIRYEAFGNPEGKPAVYLHGGPGGGMARDTAGLFDQDRWKVVLYDQRGCGESTPHAGLEANTTWHLVADLEKLRMHLGIDSWLVCGGSWGSTLALAYAQTHPDPVEALVLRGIFLCRRSEIDWMYREGASLMGPDRWERFLEPIPEAERGDLVAAYHRRLTGGDEKEALRCARAWSLWESSMLSLVPDAARDAHFSGDRFALAFARIECHYFANDSFLDPDTQLLDNAGRLAGIPGHIVHGRHDALTPPASAWELHRAWPGSKLEFVEDAGHAVTEPGIARALAAAIGSFA